MNELYLLTDDQLVALYISGTDEAFDVLLARHKDRLFSYIYYQVKNEDLANDIFQDTFTKAIVHLRNKRYTENGKFYSWISCIAHNLIIDVYRNEKHIKLVSDEEAGITLSNYSDHYENSKECEIANEQTLEDVKRLIECLPKSQREMVQMRYYMDMSFKEIAEKEGISINTALGRMRYAILNMRRIASEKNITLNWY